MAKRQQPRQTGKSGSGKSGPAPPAATVRGKTDSDPMLLRLAAGGAALLVLIVYLSALRNPFAYDDWQTVVDNGSIRNLSDLHYVFVSSFRPVINLSYAVNYALSGSDSFGYHLTGLLIHMVNVVLLFYLTGDALDDAEARTGRPTGPAWHLWARLGAAALWAVHPMMTEAVGYVSARSGLLCTSFLLASLLCLRRSWTTERRSLLVLSLLFYGIGLGCKETAAMLPFVFFAYDRLVFPGSDQERRHRLLRLHLPLFSLTFLAGGIRVFKHFHLEHGGAIRPQWQQALTQLEVFWHYLGLLLLPVSQSVVHAIHPVPTPFNPMAITCGLLILGLCVVAYLLRARFPLVPFCLVWYLAFVFPSAAVSLTEHMAEHRIYEGSASLFLLAGVGIASLRGWLAELRMPPFLPQVGFALLIVALGIGTFTRNQVWATPISLWSDATRVAPEVWAPHYALADAYREAGQCPEAIPEYQRAISILDEEPRAHTNLGLCLAQANRLDEADAAFHAALKLTPNDGTVSSTSACSRPAARTRFWRPRTSNARSSCAPTMPSRASSWPRSICSSTASPRRRCGSAKKRAP